VHDLLAQQQKRGDHPVFCKNAPNLFDLASIHSEWSAQALPEGVDSKGSRLTKSRPLSPS